MTRLALAVALMALAAPLVAQRPDSATATAGAHYAAGGLKRSLLGANYRTFWTTPIRVEVLDLARTAGGLTPTETGGGNQTLSLRFRAGDGQLYVFRSVDKDNVTLPDKSLEGSIVESIFRDLISVHHPGASVIASPILQAAGVLHPGAVLRVMPDDPALGKFRERFAGRLGNFEPYPEKTDSGRLFSGADEIIDSEDLLELVNARSTVRVDRRAFLAARLVDILLNNFDRHAGQWVWLRLPGRDTWLPVSRDHDKVLVSYEGMLNGMARVAAPHLVTFDDVYPSMAALTYNSLEFDRRLLMELDLATFDSVATALVARIDDAALRRAVANVPAAWRTANDSLFPLLRARRDALPTAARRFHERLVAVGDVHLSDADEVATVDRQADGGVVVRAWLADTAVFSRRFDPALTREIRVHLHGGDDRAVVRGSVPTSIRTRVIGGNGHNTLIDSSTVGGGRGETRLYDLGATEGIDYGKDTLWNRYPWSRYKGEWVPPGRNRGGGVQPLLTMDVRRSLGFIPGVGVAMVNHGYGRAPYASRVAALAQYATEVGGWRLTLSGDKRFEGTRTHLLATARMSDLEIVNYYGLGNARPLVDREEFHEARQRQWMFHPAIAHDLRDHRSYVSIGPVIQSSSYDSVPDRLISEERPYGFTDFGQVGARLALVHDSRGERKRLRTPKSGRLLDVAATWYPRAWDVESSYGRVGGSIVNYFTLPLPLDPIVLLRAGGARVFGDAPFHDAAFLGGRGTVRGMDLQRYAGDAAAYGTAELRVPLVRFAVVVPFEVGVFGFADAGRVWVDGESPGGWHRVLGAGVRLGIFGQFINIRVVERCWGPSPASPVTSARVDC